MHLKTSIQTSQNDVFKNADYSTIILRFMHIDYKAQDTQNKNSKRREQRLFKNYEIFQGKVRLVEDGKAPIVIERDAAIDLAQAKGLDLVQIAYTKADFPHSVCKLLDYNKFIYQQKQKEKQAKKAARANEVDVKEVDFSIRIDEHDADVKINKIKKFLEDGDKVKIIVKLLRREMHLKSMAMDTMKMILGKVDVVAELDTAPSAVGNMLSCVIRKKKNS